ncbi:hypothetical protein RJT34_29047 [Clitoria ternatea]|uniref:ceramide glucosyltransferase n=1 Tax=Clitoria ternatea TaxID=43366 RepID=A0AAN9FEY0_CLITE
MPQAIEGTIIPTNIVPTTVCGGGSHPCNEPMLATEVERPDPSLPLLNNTKKRKQNASSTLKRSMNFKELQEKLDPQWLELHLIHSHRVGQVDAKVVVAGLSTTCSQKIHNQLVGVQKMHKDTKYVLFLDDDVRLHPGSIGALTREMEKNPEV